MALGRTSFHRDTSSVRTHYLLEIDAKQFLSAQELAPDWVVESLKNTPYVVVRRSLPDEQKIPVGVRGMKRSQRWATHCPPESVKSIQTPSQLLQHQVSTSRANITPALRTLDLLKDLWRDFAYSWGPAGSVGFELATGSPVTKPESDLDVVLYSERRMAAVDAKSLYALAQNLPAVVDIRVETPMCGFSLTEFAQADSSIDILLRTPEGSVFGNDPWSSELKMKRECGV